MSSRVLPGLFGETGPAAAASAPDPAAKPAAPRKRSIRPMRIAVVLILLAAAVSAWRMRRSLPIPSLDSFLPAISMESPNTREAGPAPGPAKAEAQAEAGPGVVNAAPRTPMAARASGSAFEASSAEPVLPVIELTPLSVAEPIAEATPPVEADPVSSSVEQTASREAAAAEPSSDVRPTPPAGRSSYAVSTTAHVYGAQDSGVTPPESLGSIKQLGGLVGAIEPGTTVTIEFVVNELGLVESAKGLRTPRTVGESLLLATGLHAVKSWRFRPALKDGEPVNYRKLMSFGAN